jgi:membrane-bound lytic murein transglycosylase D
VIYTVVDRDTAPGIKTAMRKYKRILRTLARKEKQHKLHSLTSEEARIYNMFRQISERNKFHKAATQRMRAQCGQRDRFLQAIQVSGLYQKKFEQIFQHYDLPIELTRIPFVESYFNHNAYSYAGAAGIWQFMPATARMYGLRINSKIDERYDPFKSAESAARLLKANYAIFHSWPLAITAYNHGPAGLLRAVKQLETTDLGKIVHEYRGAKFGFYSRNYYAQFLAAAQVMRDPRQYFPTISPLPPLQYDQVVIQKPIFLNDLSTALAVSKKTLLTLNRDLKRAVAQSKAPLPSNFLLKLPPGKKEEFLTQYAPQTKHRT